MTERLRRLVLAPVGRPRATLVVTILLAVLAALALTRFRASGSAKDLIGDGMPSVVALQEVLDHFPTADELLVLATLEQAPVDAEAGVAALRVFASEVRACIDAHTRVNTRDPVFGKVTYAASPQLMEFISNEVVPAGLLYLSDAEIAALRERLTPRAMEAQLRQNEAMLAAPGPAASALARTLIQDPLRLREFLGSRVSQAQGSFRTWRGVRAFCWR